jgi:hypothetical protein
VAGAPNDAELEKKLEKRLQFANGRPARLCSQGNFLAAIRDYSVAVTKVRDYGV